MVAVPRTRVPYVTGQQLVAGDDVNKLIAMQAYNSMSGIIAHAGGLAPAATQLLSGLNEVATVASTSDSLKLPPAVPGTLCFVANNGSNTAVIFSYEGSTVAIDGTSGATGVNLATNKNALYACVSPTKWESILTA